MTFTQFLLVLRARWRLAAGILFGFILATVIVSLCMTKMYTAAATVVADFKPDPLSAAGYASETTTAYIATQVDIISSDRVAERAARLLKLDKSPEWIEDWKAATDGRGDILVWIASILEKALVVTPTRDSSVIEIAVTWGSPRTAAAFANAFAQAYMDTNIELRVEPAKQYAVYFDERSKALRTDLEEKQKRLSDFQIQTGIVAPTDGRLDIENSRLAELSSQLSSIQALRQDSQSRQRQVGTDPESLPEVLQSPFIAGLKADLARAEAKLEDIAANVGKNHPDYQSTAAEITDLKRRISSEAAKIAASLGSTTQVNVRREADIRAALDAQKKRMLELQHEHDEVAVLQNDVATAQRNLDAVSQHLAQSSLESQTSQTSVSLLTTAVEPLRKSSPRYLLNLAIGIFLGGVFGIGTVLFRELSDRRVREARDLVESLGVPLFGRIPGIEPDSISVRHAPALAARAEPSAI